MKVIFSQDVAGVARRDEVKEVSDGYALNFLLPRKLAVQATPVTLAGATQRKQQADSRVARAEAQAHGYLSQIQGKVVTIAAKAAPSGTLYAALSLEQITDAIQAASKVPLLPTQVVLGEHLKTIGDRKVGIKLHDGVVAQVTIRIQSA